MKFERQEMKFFFTSLVFFFLQQNFSESVIFQKNISVENIIYTDSLSVGGLLTLDGTVVLAPQTLEIGNTTQPSSVYLYGLENKNTNCYLGLDVNNKLCIYSDQVFREKEVDYSTIFTNVLNSYTAEALKINVKNGETEIGSDQKNTLTVLGRTIFLIGEINSEMSPLIFNTKLCTPGNVTVGGIFSIDNLKKENILEMIEFSAGNSFLTNDSVDFKVSSSMTIKNSNSFSDMIIKIGISPEQKIRISSLKMNNIPTMHNKLPELLLSINDENMLVMRPLPPLFSFSLKSFNQDLFIESAIVRINDTCIVNGILDLSSASDLNIIGSSINFEKTNNLVFEGDGSISCQVADFDASSQIETLIFDNFNSIKINPDLDVQSSGNFIIKCPLEVVSSYFSKVVVNADPALGYGRLMAPAGSAAAFKENIRDLEISKEFFIEHVRPVCVEDKNNTLFFIDTEKLKDTFLENIFQETVNKNIVFNNKELLALLLTQVPHIFNDLAEIDNEILQLEQ